MFVEIFICLIAVAFSVLITYFAIPVGHGYHYFAPILLLIAGYIIGLILAWCILFLLSLPYGKNKEREKPSKIASFLLRDSISYINNHARVRLIINNKQPLPSERFMLIANHRSKFDPMILTQVYGGYDLAFISKPTNFKIPIGHRFMYGSCYLPIDRYDKLKSLEVMRRAATLIENNYSSVGVFPEGTRSETGELGPFHEGVFSIAMKSKAPIVVTSFYGTENIHKNFPLKSTKVILNVIKIIYPEEYQDMTPKAVSDICYELIKNSLPEDPTYHN